MRWVRRQFDDDHDLPRPMAGRVDTATRVVRGETRLHVMREADLRSIWLRDGPKDVEDLLRGHSGDLASGRPRARPTIYREWSRTAQRLQRLASRTSEENDGSAISRARVQDGAELTCAGGEARLRACGASARNLRVSVTEVPCGLDAQPSMGWTRRLACQPKLAYEFRRAEVCGPEQRQLEPSDELVTRHGRSEASRIASA